MKIKSNLGFSFVEVLVSLFLLSLILLGLDAVGLNATRQIRNAWLLNCAINQLDNMTEWLSKNDLSDIQITRWNQQNALLLPKGKGTVTDDLTVTIFWGDISHLSCKKNQIGESGCLSKKIQA